MGEYVSNGRRKAKDHVIVHVVESMGRYINAVGIAKLIALALTSFVP